ncbi:MAG: CDP-alcohol phosphatidyltransferase family protein [Candidatus Methanofastidiosia archaeon]
MKASRGWYERNFRIFGKLMAKLGFTPNSLTLTSILIALISAYLFSRGKIILGVTFFLLSILTDALDGNTARALGIESKFGLVLDHTADRYTEFLVMLGMAWGNLADFRIIFYAFFGMFMASYVRGKAESQGVSDCTVGIMERKEKLALIIIGSILEMRFENALNLAFLVVGTLSHLTALQRLTYARRNLS